MLEICKNFYDNEGTYKPMQLNRARAKMQENKYLKRKLIKSISIVLKQFNVRL